MAIKPIRRNILLVSASPDWAIKVKPFASIKVTYLGEIYDDSIMKSQNQLKARNLKVVRWWWWKPGSSLELWWDSIYNFVRRIPPRATELEMSVECCRSCLFNAHHTNFHSVTKASSIFLMKSLRRHLNHLDFLFGLLLPKSNVMTIFSMKFKNNRSDLS